MEKLTVLHIPKTGGTTLINTFKVKPNNNFEVLGHHKKLMDQNYPIAFSIRNPIERFCSGYWSRKTDLKRKEKLKLYDEVFSHDIPDFLKLEKEIFKETNTPNDLLTLFRIHSKFRKKFFEYHNDPSLLLIMILPYTHWLGSYETFIENKYKIKYVFNLKNLSSIFLEKFNIPLLDEPFISRKRSLFSFEQSYFISEENKAFYKDWRHDEFLIYENILNSHFYIDK